MNNEEFKNRLKYNDDIKINDLVWYHLIVLNTFVIAPYTPPFSNWYPQNRIVKATDEEILLYKLENV